MQRARFSIRSLSIPIEDAIGRVAVLLNFDNEIAAADRVDAAARQKHGVAGLHRDAMNVIGDLAVSATPASNFRA